ncbi:ribosome-associated protein [Kocuria rhizophila]|uniref:Ribosomal silencing factor RsfS n=1 Tax=Kocuria rhizophila (strain ATCC 9341 / DSM 348 / NBRC 103217 / DC2201) TaxID=378753 RepID=B2GGE5_KOCRD|nr:ribosome silencing factor [Kocuria rhizophila]ASE10612.1 ribosome silencing factor [Kocuria rhizophila]MCC5671292.1 ribosome silencing factor [Kocuria rhizophila]MCC5674040.1 ribosome silencing factor [Kocuria rhizophila]MDV5999051.1 ribosome silencing factor [Kocuria rhizophila]WTI33030.1 ribosome silencing factor [Kocuria rhizophila]
MTATTESIDLVRAAALAADQKKAENVVAFDVSESLAITDVFMVASAPNERQVSAVVDAVEEALIERFDRRPLRREGKGEGRWVLLDFGDAVIHVLHDEDREFYALERLWGDCPAIDVQLPAPGRPDAAGPADDDAARAV